MNPLPNVEPVQNIQQKCTTSQAQAQQYRASFVRGRGIIQKIFENELGYYQKFVKLSEGEMTIQIDSLEVWFNAGVYSNIIERQICRASLKSLNKFRMLEIKRKADIPAVIRGFTRLWQSWWSKPSQESKSQRNQADNPISNLSKRFKMDVIEQELVPFKEQ